uniref:Uncharacterized protein n=1 Tax=Pseudo-nitzschia australis TaxID=44445 RepID=A0A6U9ZMF8_9STRA|mmetsp:Transcript_20549/g.43448  ORF Transcript_20549/g.43448 Transcript_20549/m.43448 type:complete len:235 (+) Transcript_20549:99-803(+)
MGISSNILPKRLLMRNTGIIVALVAASSTMLFCGTTALISPHQSLAVVHRSATGVMTRTTTTRSFQKQYDFVGSSHQSHLPRLLQRRQSSVLRFGFGNGNDNSNNAPGGADMDPGLKLLVCILIDFIGVASFAAPGLGEATDVGWAPISAFLVNYLFGNGLFTALALVEELSPGFDFVPTATIAWFLENSNREAEAGPPSQSAPPPSSQSQSPSQTTRNGKPADSGFIDVDIVD